MAERPAFELDHIDRQMADMMTTRELALEGLILLAMPYQVRGGSFQWFLVFSHRIVRFLRHWRSLRLWASFLSGWQGGHAVSWNSTSISSDSAAGILPAGTAHYDMLTEA
jgi:hypothetical protein